jgi:hypothetical protein
MLVFYFNLMKSWHGLHLLIIFKLIFFPWWRLFLEQKCSKYSSNTYPIHSKFRFSSTHKINSVFVSSLGLVQLFPSSVFCVWSCPLKKIQGVVNIEKRHFAWTLRSQVSFCLGCQIKSGGKNLLFSGILRMLFLQIIEIGLDFRKQQINFKQKIAFRTFQNFLLLCYVSKT